MTSQAWTYSERGIPQDILALTSRPMPTLPPPLPLPKDVPTPEEWLLIKVKFAALNPGAIFQMTLFPPFVRAKTSIPDMDFSGTVLDVWHPDASSSRFKKSDKVVCMLPAAHTMATGTGALAEHVRVPARYVVPKPEGSSFADAAGLMLPALTARQMVVEAAVKEGDRVLVNAASGGIGTMVVQMVRNVVGEKGFVVGICSGKNADMVKSLGADEVIDYTQQENLPNHLTTLFSDNPFNAIIDTLGHQSIYLASPNYLIPTGIYSSVGIKPPDFSFLNFLRAVIQMMLNEWWPVSPWLFGVGRRWMGVAMMAPTLEDRERVVGMLGRGEVRIVRDSVWEFGDVKEAYERLGGLHARGKVLVRVDPATGDDEV
ncbi:Fc.00g047220.m01.CDS01 [Cosmosporella sp. VM-42]